MLKNNLKLQNNISTKIVAVFLFAFLSLLFAFTYSQKLIAEEKKERNAEINFFVKSIAQKYNFNERSLKQLIDSAEFVPEIITLIDHPREQQPWYLYKKHFVSDSATKAGVDYWKRHARALNYVEKYFGVPAQIIVAIVGIESSYGKARLKYRVLDSLVTLGFFYDRRTGYFQNELAEYLLLTRDLGLNPLNIFGSYAGAIGLAQFMPSNYRKFGIVAWNTENQDIVNNENKNKKYANLMEDTDDVIFSVANFLKNAKWNDRGTVAKKRSELSKKCIEEFDSKNVVRIVKSEDVPSELCNGESCKIFAAKNNKLVQVKHGKFFDKKYNKNKTDATTPIDYRTFQFVSGPNQCEYWTERDNFRALSKYNNNKQYVLVVYVLSEEIKNAILKVKKNQ